MLAPSINAKKHLGQHFLIDDTVISRIIATLNPQPTECLVEIGPGQGALTNILIKSVKRLDVIEIDPRMTASLNQLPSANLVIHLADILKFDFDQLPAPWRMIGNLPYYISSPILMRLIRHRHQMVDAHIMLQKEVVDRITAKPNNKTYGRLSVMIQAYFHASHLFDIPNHAFLPKPQVKSAMLYLVPQKTTIAFDTLAGIVKMAFANRRKTLKNGLKSILEQKDTELDLNRRAETLTVNEFIHLTNTIIKNHEKPDRY